MHRRVEDFFCGVCQRRRRLVTEMHFLILLF